MSLRKLTTTPCSRDLVSGRKLLRSRNGHALTWIQKPVSIFWTYDDGGENDPGLDLAGWPGFGNFRRLNLPGSITLHTDDSLSHRSTVRMWPYEMVYAFLSEGSSPRGMTFWMFGLKIHVTACEPVPLDEEADFFLCKIERKREEGGTWTRNVLVNGVDRGPWLDPVY